MSLVPQNHQDSQGCVGHSYVTTIIWNRLMILNCGKVGSVTVNEKVVDTKCPPDGQGCIGHGNVTAKNLFSQKLSSNSKYPTQG